MAIKQPWYSGQRYDEARRQREADHQSAEAAAVREAEESRRSNQQVRAEYLASLAAARQARVKQDEAAFDASIAGEKAVRQREWLVAHPRETAADFEKIWPLIRAELVAADSREAAETTRQQLIGSEIYAGLI